MDTVYPAATSALARGRRRRRGEPRHQRYRTMPVTFAEIKEVDEDKEQTEECQAASVGSVASAVEERRRRLDFMDERLGREFAEFRRRRARRDLLREQLREPDAEEAASEAADEQGTQAAAVPSPRAASEPHLDAEPS